MLSTFFKSKAAKIIGVDIGSNSIKAVLLSKSGNGYKVENVASLPLPRGIVVDNAITDLQTVGNVVKSIKNKFSKSGANFAAAAVSGSGVIMKTIYMNTVKNDEELESQIEIEAENLIPYPLDEVSIDFEIIQKNEVNDDKIDVLLVASRTELVQARVQALEFGKLQAKVIDVEGYALGRAIVLVKHQLSDAQYKLPVALVDIGASMLTVAIVVEGKTVFVKEQPFGGDQYTQSIVSYYGMDMVEADLAKMNGELPRNYAFEVLAPFQTALAQQIKRTLQMFGNSKSDSNIVQVLLSGGCATIEGIDLAIEEELSIPCTLSKPFLHCEVDKTIDFDQLNNEGAHYMMASGLALRNFS
jgi:type IV pilus assembly protein PilM